MVKALAKIITGGINFGSKATAVFSTKVSSIATMYSKLLRKAQFLKFGLIGLCTFFF